MKKSERDKQKQRDLYDRERKLHDAFDGPLSDVLRSMTSNALTRAMRGG